MIGPVGTVWVVLQVVRKPEAFEELVAKAKAAIFVNKGLESEL